MFAIMAYSLHTTYKTYIVTVKIHYNPFRHANFKLFLLNKNIQGKPSA